MMAERTTKHSLAKEDDLRLIRGSHVTTTSHQQEAEFAPINWTTSASASTSHQHQHERPSLASLHARSFVHRFN
ncbi:MAG: hypothetical protein CMP47_14445 [Rickettsiales bacterium]|nr:hypothetical protein [Rickettsiales bacterium]